LQAVWIFALNGHTQMAARTGIKINNWNKGASWTQRDRKMCWGVKTASAQPTTPLAATSPATARSAAVADGFVVHHEIM
jgi:hypothetical protein